MIWDLIYIILYFEFIGFSFLLFKHTWEARYKRWSKSDRNFFIGVSLLGPISLLLALAFYFTEG
jgi:hypothetical protein